MKMLKNNKKLILLGLIFLTCCFNCSKNNIEKPYIMKIDNVILRKSIFIRRFKYTNTFKNGEVTTNKMMDFLNRVYKPELLLVKAAYEKGLNQDKFFKSRMNQYEKNLISSAHPIFSQNIIIQDNQLREFYKKKNKVYTLKVIKTLTYKSADSLYQRAQSGKQLKLQKPDSKMPNSFPSYKIHKNITLGEKIHPKVSQNLLENSEAKVLKPVETFPFWTVALVKSERTKQLPPYSGYKEELKKDYEPINRETVIQQYLDQTKDSLNFKDHSQKFYKKIKNAFESKNNKGIINKRKFDQKVLKQPVFISSLDTIDLDEIITEYNLNATKTQPLLKTTEDVKAFFNTIANRELMFNDLIRNDIKFPEIITDKIVNKKYAILRANFLKRISNNIEITDQEAQDYYFQNRDKYKGDFNNVKANIYRRIRTQKAEEKIAQIKSKIQAKYGIKYNKKLIREIAEQLSKDNIK
ncbi:MAG: hypothetical protein K9M80_02660 [Candidatus Marinimicrobia bacterium]|nr:hypothetical protein [Candidatus Neomarinimicrobiota bacterium]